MPNSLAKTTVALFLAAFAVLVTAGVAMRDFIRDVDASCPGTLTPIATRHPTDPGRPVPMQVVDANDKDPPPLPPGTTFRLVYEVDLRSYPATYRNVHLDWLGASAGAEACRCASLPFELTFARDRGPYSVSLTHDPVSGQYVLERGEQNEARFTIDPAPTHRVQPNRILSRRHLSLAVSFAAFLALGVAWLRQRTARMYALTMHAWREAELTSTHLIQSETGEMLGALAASSSRSRRHRSWTHAGTILVAPEALGGSGLYRDVPVIEPRHVARGGHDAWARATMIRLRDARVLAALSTLTSVLALAAHLGS